ncbi:IS1 family transposase [Escherichia coli]
MASISISCPSCSATEGVVLTSGGRVSNVWETA